MAAVKALQQWCKLCCEGYRDVAITNMTTSFRDGLAFCALIHKHRPDLIKFDSLSKENIYENNHLAFRVAEEELSIPALLDAEDMVALKVPDRLSILTYVSQYYNYFHGRNPIGGMAGIKRPADEPSEERPGKKNQPVTAQVFNTPKTDTENKRDVLIERSNKSGSVSSNCNVCQNHVHLVQRHLVDGKLYHRNCFKCNECSNILLSGTYKPGKQPNTFICKTHPNLQKPPPAQATQATPTLHNNSVSTAVKTTPAIKITPYIPKDQNSTPASTSSGKSPAQHKPSSPWSVGKTDRPSSPKPTPHSNLPTARSEALNVTVKGPSDTKQLTETPKRPNSTVLKNQEARQRFFEANTSTGSSVTASNISTTSPSFEVKVANSGQAGGAGPSRGVGKGRVLLQPPDVLKEKKDKVKEKENEKEKAKSFISQLVIEETSKNSNRYKLKTNVTCSVSPVGNSSKGPHVRTKLTPPAADLEPNNNSPSSGWFRNKDKETSKPATTPPPSNKEAETAPSDWRSMLKPVAKDTKSGNTKIITPPDMHSKTPESVSRPMAPDTNTPLSSRAAPSLPTPVSTSSERPKSPVAKPRKNGPAPFSKDIDSKSGSSTTPGDSSSETKTENLPKLKPNYIPKHEIMGELRDIELNLDELEKQGVLLEKQLRSCEEEGKEDTSMNDLMVEWFNLIRNKQVYMRRESELVYIARTQDLEEEQPNVEAELRKLMEKPDHLKTYRDRKREEELMAKLVEIVNDRNAIVDGLDEDRLREEEEDEQLNKMMQDLDIKKEKKKKSPMSKLFGWKS
ncbi:protein-methionine sulfoxide oxidase mical2b [Hoplias malabaricus]|uniref:protein-methionine sulfoxide oxidase mical2b n=1 Tax=Hoplias malabaricus TaxID=27720 RepID=UPI0034621198